MKKALLLTLIGFTLFGCISDNEDTLNNNVYSKYITKNSIKTGIDFMPVETYQSYKKQEPLLILKLVTSKIFPCVNYGLSISKFINNNELIIRFNKIVEPKICLTAIGPATSYVDLPHNINKIIFINGNVIDKYAIEINEQKISITPIKNNFTKSLYDKTFRFPKNSFAYVCGTNKTNTYIYEDFASIIEKNSDFKEFKFGGEGRIPYPESSDGNWVNHPSKYYTYSNPEEFKKLAELLNDYAAKNIKKNSGVTISIYSWNNVNFHSWIKN